MHVHASTLTMHEAWVTMPGLPSSQRDHCSLADGPGERMSALGLAKGKELRGQGIGADLEPSLLC